MPHRSAPESPAHDSALTVAILIALALLGLVLLLVSLRLDEHGVHAYYRELLKELGIVIMAVFSVSLLYEIALARRYSADFLAKLRGEIEQGESNAAVCAHLGIERIFPHRDEFELAHPIPSFEPLLGRDASLRIVARTLFLCMSKTETLRKVLHQGALVELCAFDPTCTSDEIARSPDLEVSDIESAVSIFRKQLAEWVAITKPTGTLILRVHKYPLLDSYFRIRSNDQSFAAWDWSFGRDLVSKRIVVLNPQRPLGRNVEQRYDIIWQHAETRFEYSNGMVKIDELATLFP